MGAKNQLYPERDNTRFLTGGDRYAITVWCNLEKKGSGALSSRCSCPVGNDGCKHAVAVIAEYLDLLGKGADIPTAEPGDERWELLSRDNGGDDDEDQADDVESGSDPDEYAERSVARRTHIPGAGRKAQQVTDEKIRSHINAKSREELAALLWALTQRFPELHEELRDRIALGEGDMDRLVAQARKELKRVCSEAGWRNNWTGEGHTPDYSRLKHRLERLLESGHADAVANLGPEIMALGMEQIGQSNDEGETAEALADCLPVIFRAVAASTLPTARKLLFITDAHLRDDYGVIDAVDEDLLQMPADKTAWSEVADVLAKRLKSPVKEEDSFSRKYQRTRTADWLIDALKKAGRDDEVLAVCEREARASDSYERLITLLLEKKQYDDAERWAAEGIEKTAGKLPGIAASLGKLMAKAAEARKQWNDLAAHAALEFFEHPSHERFKQLISGAGKAACQDCVRSFSVGFLETGRSPFCAARRKGVSEFEVHKDWPLPVPHYLVPLFRRMITSQTSLGPHYDVLIDMAIADRRNDDVLRWYDATRAGQGPKATPSPWFGHDGYADRVAAAVSESHPERALAIYRKKVDDNLQRAHISAYESVAAYLRKMRPLLKRLHQEDEWNNILTDIRARYRNRPRFIEILGRLDAPPILTGQRPRH
jgi:uncharacterized Zn finger protein